MTALARSTQEEIRRHNLGTLLRRVHLGGPTSRASLTDTMGVNRSTIKALVGELTAAGLVSETVPDVLTQRGRPSYLVAARRDTAHVLAASVGVDAVTVAAIGLGGAVLARHEFRLAGRGVKPEAVVRRLVTEFERVTAALPATCWLAGVGVAVPGIVRHDDGWVEFAPNLMWRGVALGALLRERLGVNRASVAVDVRIGNDGDLGGLAEHARGAGRGIKDVIYIAGEVGVGGGIILDDRLLAGAQGYAGEVGHMIVNPGGRRCRCGSRGCFETEVGVDAVLAACGRPVGGGRTALREVFTAANTGERRATEGLRQIAIWVARGLATLVSLFNPEAIILGGPASSLYFLTGDLIRSELETLTRLTDRREVRLLRPALGPDSSLIGAAELAFERLLDAPTSSSPGGGAARGCRGSETGTATVGARSGS